MTQDAKESCTKLIDAMESKDDLEFNWPDDGLLFKEQKDCKSRQIVMGQQPTIVRCPYLVGDHVLIRPSNERNPNITFWLAVVTKTIDVEPGHVMAQYLRSSKDFATYSVGRAITPILLPLTTIQCKVELTTRNIIKVKSKKHIVYWIDSWQNETAMDIDSDE